MLQWSQYGVQAAAITKGDGANKGAANGQCIRYGNAGDTTNNWQGCAGLYVGVAGNVAILDENGQTLVVGVTVSGVIPIRACRVLATGTTASSIFALFPQNQ